MSKANWNKSPEWAKFFAIDESGQGNWFENRPVFLVSFSGWDAEGRYESAGYVDKPKSIHKFSVEERP